MVVYHDNDKTRGNIFTVVSSLKTRSRRLRVLSTSHFAFCMFNEQVLRTSHLAGGLLISGRTSHLAGGDLILTV